MLTCQYVLLALTPAKMKKKLAEMGNFLDGSSGSRIEDLIDDLESVSKDFTALSEMCATAAARVNVVHRKLI